MDTGLNADCRQCETEMHEMKATLMIQLKPRIMRQCPTCLKRVLIYEAVQADPTSHKEGSRITTIKLWSNEMQGHYNVSEYAEKRAADRGLRILQ